MLWYSYFTIRKELPRNGENFTDNQQCAGLGKLHRQQEERYVVNKTLLAI